MIEIILHEVDMPELSERRYKKEFKDSKWIVIDTCYNDLVYRGNFVNASLTCHNLNKKFYDIKNSKESE